MIDFEKLKKNLAEANVFTQYTGATILNTNLVCYLGEEETFPISITEDNGKIILSDFGQTFDKLDEQDITLEDEETANYVNKVLSTLNVTMGPSRELMVKTDNEQTCVSAIGRLYQAIILLSYLDLQFEYEDEE
jgi:hypothetical protein